MPLLYSCLGSIQCIYRFYTVVSDHSYKSTCWRKKVLLMFEEKRNKILFLFSIVVCLFSALTIIYILEKKLNICCEEGWSKFDLIPFNIPVIMWVLIIFEENKIRFIFVLYSCVPFYTVTCECVAGRLFHSGWQWVADHGCQSTGVTVDWICLPTAGLGGWCRPATTEAQSLSILLSV